MRQGTLHRSTRKPGKLVPAHARRLRARSVRLEPGQMMPWHSTRAREELLIGWTGRLRVEIDGSAGRTTARLLMGGQSLFLPAQTRHRVLNLSRSPAHYLYVTG